MNDDTYNGWANWATWNTNLWLTNDEGLLVGAQEIVRRHVGVAANEDGTPFSADIFVAGEALREWWDELFAPEDPGPLGDAWNAHVGEVNW